MLRNMQATAGCLALALAIPGVTFATGAWAPADPPSSPATAPGASVFSQGDAQALAAATRRQISAEALAAVAETRSALRALDHDDRQRALAALEKAAGKLEILLARDPQLALAPTDVSSVRYNLVADVAQVRELRQRAEDLLAKGRLQDARHLLRMLASETAVRVTSIPLATYPEAIRRAVQRIDRGKPDEAREALQVALNALVVGETIFPVPLAAAEQALQQAGRLAQASPADAGERQRLQQLLGEARRQLELAQALDYGERKDHERLQTELERLDAHSAGLAEGGVLSRIKAALPRFARRSDAEPAQATQPPASSAW